MTTTEKPLLRGVSHQLAFFCAVGAGAVLVAMSRTAHAALAIGIYAATLAAMLGISACYHRGTWGPRALAFWRRADHATIFCFIAGTYTPIALLAIGGAAGARLLAIAWSGAALGALQAILWTNAPRWLAAGLYVALGWTLVAYWPEAARALPAATIALI